VWQVVSDDFPRHPFFSFVNSSDVVSSATSRHQLVHPKLFFLALAHPPGFFLLGASLTEELGFVNSKKAPL
jgi:hypothetical protein